MMMAFFLLLYVHYPDFSYYTTLHPIYLYAQLIDISSNNDDGMMISEKDIAMAFRASLGSYSYRT